MDGTGYREALLAALARRAEGEQATMGTGAVTPRALPACEGADRPASPAVAAERVKGPSAREALEAGSRAVAALKAAVWGVSWWRGGSDGPNPPAPFAEREGGDGAGGGWDPLLRDVTPRWFSRDEDLKPGAAVPSEWRHRAYRDEARWSRSELKLMMAGLMVLKGVRREKAGAWLKGDERHKAAVFGGDVRRVADVLQAGRRAGAERQEAKGQAMAWEGEKQAIFAERAAGDPTPRPPDRRGQGEFGLGEARWLEAVRRPEVRGLEARVARALAERDQRLIEAIVGAIERGR